MRNVMALVGVLLTIALIAVALLKVTVREKLTGSVVLSERIYSLAWDAIKPSDGPSLLAGVLDAIAEVKVGF